MTFVGDPTLTSDEAQIVYMSGDNLHSINQFCKIELDPFFISKDKIVCVCVCVCVCDSTRGIENIIDFQV